jgi:acetoin utilization deacetylase AcuC-like enzyme
LEVLKSRGIETRVPAPCGLAPALAVHAQPYLDFLAIAWLQWSEIDGHGPEVWPSYFPYWSGRPDQDTRPACPTEAILGQAGWYLGDLSSPPGPSTWLSAMRSYETAVAGAQSILDGEAHAYALCRPSGHHARSDRAAGLCFLNNAAIAAQLLRGKFDRVAVLDIDVHHGDGTQEIFYRRPDVLTVSIHADPRHAYPFFTGHAHEAGFGAGLGANLNLPLPRGAGRGQMLAAVDVAAKSIRDFAADALVFAVGFDAHNDDPVGLCALGDDDFGEIAQTVKALGVPTLIVHEGGYAIDVIGRCLDAVLGPFLTAS